MDTKLDQQCLVDEETNLNNLAKQETDVEAIKSLPKDTDSKSNRKSFVKEETDLKNLADQETDIKSNNSSLPKEVDSQPNHQSFVEEETTLQEYCNLNNLAAQETDIEAIKSSLPNAKGYLTDHFYNYQGFWYDEHFLKGVLRAQTHFKAQPTDILLATFPKTGLTWLKALTYAIMNRTHLGTRQGIDPLLAKNPHELVPYLEFQAYEKDPFSSLDSIPSPRLLSTHISYDSLPKSVISSNCRIICIAREPKDVFVSMWSFISKIITIGGREDTITMEETFKLFCDGVSLLGPFWDHVLGYWKASMEFPTRVLFLKYEDLKKDTVFNVEWLAEFIGQPFSSEEQATGVAEAIVKLCSIERLKSLEMNKNGVYHLGRDSNAFVDKSAYFRKGEVGDWKNHLTVEMVQRIDQITAEKFGAYGFKY